ncbi:MAG TPA: sigma-54 dependent transcriptional regulator [Cytophagaceae bacterium]|nr:sigma-54 dependent transcriptional regulator [Cytophagaceae bacterium]
MHKVLIIDDEEKLRNLLSRIIALEGYEVQEASNGKAGLKKLESYDIDVILCDVKLPDASGVQLVKDIKTKYPMVETIVMTAYGNIPDGVQAMKNGAFDYITKGDDNNKIIPLLARATEKATLQKRISALEKQVNKKYSFENIIGKSKAILQAVELAKKVAPTDTSVLLLGETGTGKEVVAQAIHQESQRKNKSFVAINCSAFGKDILESELFGYKAGAFTGAVKDKKGLLEEAHNGTLFLDELGEMSLELQAKLLRVLETGEFIKVGDTKSTKVNVRLIAATHKDLLKEAEQGHFRSDLYYRLSVFQIILPALKDRINDIELLAKYFLTMYTDKANKKIPGIGTAYLERLKLHSWPGNIRELKNVIERSVILHTSGELSIDSLPMEILQHTTSSDGKILSAFDLSSVEQLHIRKVLNYTNGNKTETARLLNIALTTLYRKLEEYNIH